LRHKEKNEENGFKMPFSGQKFQKIVKNGYFQPKSVFLRHLEAQNIISGNQASWRSLFFQL